jgi:hypothetical protein
MADDMRTVLRQMDVPELERLQRKYEGSGQKASAQAIVGELKVRAGEKPVQTAALQDSGKLFQHKFKADDDSGRTFTAYSGDVGVFLQPFTEPGMTVRVPREEFTGRNSPQAKAAAAADARALEVGRRALAAGIYK